MGVRNKGRSMEGISMFNTIIISFQADTCLAKKTIALLDLFHHTKQIEMTRHILFVYLRLIQD